VHLAGAERAEAAGGEEEDEEDEEILTLRTLAKQAAERRREEARERAGARQLEEEQRRTRAVDQEDARALSVSDYGSRLRAQVRRTVAGGYVDHTAALSPRALRRLCRQVQKFDKGGEGRLSFNDFCSLCTRVAEVQSVKLNSMQLFALFTQADVTGEKAICASQWCWARGQLANLLTQQLRAQGAREERRRAAASTAQESKASADAADNVPVLALPAIMYKPAAGA